MSKTFTQSEWGRVRGISMPVSGCGPCSVACIGTNIDPNLNPRKVAEWLADRGDFYSSGTTRSGITSALEHYGFTVEGYYKPEHAGGTSWKNAIAKMQSLKEDWWAIFLTVGKSNGAKDNFWTSGGHFLACTDLSNGKLYIRDSGARGNTGYFSPEKLRYDTNCIWVVTKKSAKRTYTGTFPTLPKKQCLVSGDTGEQVKNLQLFLRWYGTYRDKVDKDFGAKTRAAVIAFQKAEKLSADGSFGPKSLAKAKTIKR